jgi:hypothetical protein
MSMDAGIGGAWGLLLSDQLVEGMSEAGMLSFKSLYQELKSYVDNVRNDPETDYTEDPDNYPEINQFADRFRNLLADNGIIVPEGIALYHTGSDDDRPARCSTPHDDWVLGWGVFTSPWKFPEIHESFRKITSLHSWVWMG